MTNPWIGAAAAEPYSFYAYWMRGRYEAMPLIGLPTDRPNASAYGLSSANGWACGGLGAPGLETTVLRWPLIAPLADLDSAKFGSAVASPRVPARALSINAQGDCAGSYLTADQLPKSRAFVKRSGDANAIDLTPLLGTDRSTALCINDHGAVVGEAANDLQESQAFYWDGASAPVLLGRLPGHVRATATSINNSGTIVGVSSAQSGVWQAFIARGQGLEDLGQRVWGDGVVINDRGIVAASVFFDGVTPHAAILDTNKTPWVWENLDTGSRAYKGSLVNGINDSGHVVGSWRYTSDADPGRGFLFRDGHMQDINSFEIDWPRDRYGYVLYAGPIQDALAIDNVGRVLAEFTGGPVLLNPLGRNRHDLLLTYLGFLGGVTQGGGGIGIGPSGPVPIGPPVPLTREERELFVALAARELASLTDGAAQEIVLRASHETLERAVAAIRRADQASEIPASVSRRPG